MTPELRKFQQHLTYDLPVKPGQEMTSGNRRLIAERSVNLLLYHTKYHKRFPDLCNPQLFTEKALHRALFDRRPIRTLFGDKYAVREYVTNRIGDQHLPKLHHVTDDPNTIPFEDLPDKFVIKSSKGSRNNQVIIVTDKSTINESNIIQECKSWLSHDYYKESGGWDYKNFTARILVEEYINDGNKASAAPYDYKFFTYNGVPHAIQVHTGRFEDFRVYCYDIQWNKLPINRGRYESNLISIPRPPHLETMLDLAQKLGKGIDFVRIDFYDTPKKSFWRNYQCPRKEHGAF